MSQIPSSQQPAPSQAQAQAEKLPPPVQPLERKLYLLGVGPGDPELLTLKALRLIQEVDLLFAPCNKGQHRSLDVCLPYLNGRSYILMDVPMGEMTLPAYQELAATLAQRLEPGQSAAYLTIGDALTYSTAYLLQAFLPADLKVEFVPGLSSYALAFNKCGLPMSTKGGRFLLCDEWPEFAAASSWAELETIALLKVGRQAASYMQQLEDLGFTPVYLANLGLPTELICHSAASLPPELGYFALIIARKRSLL